MNKPHYWSWCSLCEHDVVICGKCGNNTCSGGYGTVDGKECDACATAYQVYLNKMNSGPNIKGINDETIPD